MEKIAINPSRLQWCCNILAIDISKLHQDTNIAEKTLNKAINGEAVLSINQLENIANFFNRSLLFFLNPKDVQGDKIYSPHKRQKELGINQKIPRNYRHREPINIFGRPYVATVLEARQNKHITLNKASTYLDGLKIHTLHKLESEFV